MSTSIHGNGPNAFDLASSGGGLGFGDGGGGGSAMGYYESQMQNQIQQALEKNPVTRRFAGTLHLHLSVDASGAVTSVSLDQSSGDPKVDAAITQSVLSGMQFPAPPNGTPDTFPMNLTAEQPL
jgi:TonB family protein